MTPNLLIAESDAELRDIYDRLSSALGFHVETAADGLECWSKLCARSPDALVVDVDLLWGGGDGVLACLRDGFEGAPVPAAFVTGDHAPDVLSRRFGIPTGRCFQKPYRLTALLDSVRNVVAAARPFAALAAWNSRPFPDSDGDSANAETDHPSSDIPRNAERH